MTFKEKMLSSKRKRAIFDVIARCAGFFVNTKRIDTCFVVIDSQECRPEYTEDYI